MVTVLESRADLRTADGLMDVYRFQPEGPGPWPGVILYMDAIGIRPDLKSMAARLAGHGYVVVLPHLFYRSAPVPAVKLEEFVRPGAERDRVFALIQSIDGPMVMRDTATVLDYLDTLPAVRAPLGAVGYCMGGGYALRAAATFPSRFRAAAAFHASRLATDAADSPHLLASRMHARVYVGVAELDHMFSPQERERLRDALATAGIDFTIEVYPGVGHGFAVTGHPVYDADASERHWQRVQHLLGETLPASGAPA